LQPRILYPASLSFRIEKEIKSILDEKKLKTSSPLDQPYKKYFFKPERKGINPVLRL